jgi:hypothetical protein
MGVLCVSDDCVCCDRQTDRHHNFKKGYRCVCARTLVWCMCELSRMSAFVCMFEIIMCVYL